MLPTFSPNCRSFIKRILNTKETVVSNTGGVGLVTFRELQFGELNVDVMN